MSFEHGWAALHLEAPPRIPRTEYSADFHWGLVSTVTGIEVDYDSSAEVRDRASRAFMEAWDYDLVWATNIGPDEFGEMRTRMGHAVYQAGNADWDPTVTRAFHSPEEVLRFDPREAFGRHPQSDLITRFEEHYAAQCARVPNAVNMSGIYVTLVSGLIDLFGWELLLEAAGEDPIEFGQLANRYAEWVSQYFEALAASDVPVAMVHDDFVWSSGAIFAPAWYREYVFPNYRRLIGSLVDSGKRVIFTADGDYSEFVDDLAATGAHVLVMEPMTDMAGVAARYGQSHGFVGNADTRILLSGTADQIRGEVARCVGIGKSCPGYFLAVGNHIPPNKPVESALTYEREYRRLMWR